MTASNIRSLRMFFDVEGVRECEPQERQIKMGARVEVKGGRGTIVDTITKWGCVLIDWGRGTEIVDLRDLQSNVLRIWRGKQFQDRNNKTETKKVKAHEAASTSGTFLDVINRNLKEFEQLISHLSFTTNPER